MEQKEFKFEIFTVNYCIDKSGFLRIWDIIVNSNVMGKFSMPKLQAKQENKLYSSTLNHEREVNEYTYYLEEYQTETPGYIRFLYLKTPLNDIEGYMELLVPVHEVEDWLHENGCMSGETWNGDSPDNLRYQSWSFNNFYQWAEETPDPHEIMQEFLNYKLYETK
jgi:hypothetical protein